MPTLFHLAGQVSYDLSHVNQFLLSIIGAPTCQDNEGHDDLRLLLLIQVTMHDLVLGQC